MAVCVVIGLLVFFSNNENFIDSKMMSHNKNDIESTYLDNEEVMNENLENSVDLHSERKESFFESFDRKGDVFEKIRENILAKRKLRSENINESNQLVLGRSPYLIAKKSTEQLEEIALCRGLPVPNRPFVPYMNELYRIIEGKGYDLEGLHEYNQILIEDFFLASEDFKSLEPKTDHLMRFYQDNDRVGLEQIIKERLRVNKFDIPALLIRLNIHLNLFMDEEAFKDVNDIIQALDYFEPKVVSKEAIIDQSLFAVSTIAYATEEYLSNRKPLTKLSTNPMTLFILHRLEAAGDW
jgi:hypothetical protein